MSQLLIDYVGRVSFRDGLVVKCLIEKQPSTVLVVKSASLFACATSNLENRTRNIRNPGGAAHARTES
jgi:hypothetical protein